MNTNTKYYTPTIEEFHVGFEFEQKIGTSVSTKDEVWLKSIFSFIPNADKILEILSGDLIRAKLLDKDDLYDLQFCPIKINDILFYRRGHSAFEGEIGSQYIIHTTWSIQVFSDTELCIEQSIENTRTKELKKSIIFYGEIKNKSELQKLMIQLNIKDQYEDIQKTFVDTPKGKMWFDHKAYQNEKQWMEDKLNGKK